ncbi:MAG: tripartite tricarboxylate transporter TctB family protein [Rhodospirillales bacterium]|nr:tripartite tricarboxylate transporter TctB family protein [Rhodospirillales bacterium]
MQKQVDPKADIILAIGMILFSGLIYLGSQDLPPPRYEPMGSAAVPQGLAVLMALLSVLLIFRALPHLKTFQASANQITDVTPRPVLAIIVFALTLIFIALLDFGILSFIPAGILYMTAIGYFLTHRNLKRMPRFFVFSVLMVVSNYYLFTRVFYIDLP